MESPFGVDHGEVSKALMVGKGPMPKIPRGKLKMLQTKKVEKAFNPVKAFKGAQAAKLSDTFHSGQRAGFASVKSGGTTGNPAMPKRYNSKKMGAYVKGQIAGEAAAKQRPLPEFLR